MISDGTALDAYARADEDAEEETVRTNLIEKIRTAATKRVLFLPHAVRQMSRPERMISTGEVREILAHGEAIEEYPDDPRGPSALLLGDGTGGRAIHVVVAPKGEYAAVITAYVPDPTVWHEDMRTRRKS
jgi:hypothetical protein